MARTGNITREVDGLAVADVPESAPVSTIRPLPSRSLPIAPGKQAGVRVFLLIADAVVLTAAGLLAMSHLPEQIWRILIVAGVVLFVQGAGFAIGIYDTRSVARLQRACLAVFGLVLALTVLAAFVAYTFAGPSAVLWPCVLSSMAMLELMFMRMVLAIGAERFAASVAERVVLVGTPYGVARVLRPEPDLAGNVAGSIAKVDIEARLAGWICLSMDGNVTRSSTFGMTVRGVGAPLCELRPANCEPAVLAQEVLMVGDALVTAGRVDRVVIAAADLSETAVEWTVKRLEKLSFEFSLAPLATLKGEILDRGNCVVLRPAAISPFGLIAKRAMDLIVGFCVLICVLPLALVIALLIRRSSPGPVLFRQERWGLNNVPFTVYKFRTMWVNALATDGSVQATRNDPRVTPIGALLRRTSLDELPQVLNVLNGTMSLVGPRPHPVELNRRCVGEIANYLGRHRVPPGITGLAQIKGFRGETRSSEVMQRRVDFDVEYIKMRSITLDVGILLKTFVSILRAENAY